MITELETLPVLDWEQSLRLAGFNNDLAQDMLTMFTKDLPSDFAEIKKSYAAANFADMQKQVHKLHGAVSYIGAPRLKEIVACLDSKLKAKITDDLPTLMQIFDQEVTLLLEQTAERVS